MAEKKLAYRRVVKNEDNEIRLMYVDTATGQPIHPDDIGDYTLLDQGTAGVTGDLDLEGKDKKTAAEEITDPLLLRDNTTTEGGEGWQYNFAGSMPRNPSNNYGFIDKNIAIKALGKLGIPGKALNLAINGNNIEATNAARETLGLGPMSTKEAISSLVAGRDGYVADVKIGDEQYSVGLKAMDRAGRTTLTPMEARNRSLHTGFGLVEATPAERKQSIADARANPDIQKSRGGVLGKIGRAAVGAVTGGLAGAAGAIAGEVGSLRGPRGTYEEPVSRPAAPWGFGPQANPVQTYRTTPHGELLGPTMPSNMSVPDVGAINSPAFGAAGARGMQGFDVGPGGMANTASPAFGARGASEMQGYAPPAGPSPAFGARGASEYTPGAGMRTDVPTPTARPERARSRGLQDVADVTAPVGYRYEMGPKRPEAPGQKIQDRTQEVVQDVLGPGHTINVVSGQEGDLPQYGSSRHKTGLSQDIYITDPNGRLVTDEVALNAVATEFAARNPTAGIGFGQGYMNSTGRTPGRMHLDITGRGGAWGAQNTWKNMDPTLHKNIGHARATGQGAFPLETDAVPTERPDPEVVRAEQQLQAVGAAPGSFRAAQEEDYFGFDKPSFAEQTRADLTQAVTRPDQVDTRPREVRERMAKTIAGELGKETLQGIINGDPEIMATARQEIAAIAGTMDNRANSSRYANMENPYEAVLASDQYHANRPGNKKTTEGNYALTGDFINQALIDYDYGVNPSPFPDATHYTANWTNPDWEQWSMGGPLQSVGEHKFGTVSLKGYPEIAEYRPSGSGFGRIAGGGESSIGLSRTTDASSFGSGFSSGFDRESGDSYGGFSTSRSSNYGSSSARSGQSRAGVSSENRSGGYDVGRSGESSFGGFSAGSLGGSASGRGSGYGSTGSGGYSSFSRESGDSYGAGSSSGWSGGGYSGGSSGGRSSGPSSSSPAGGSQAAGGWSGGGRSSSSGGGSYSGGSAKDSGEHSSGSGGFGGTNV